MATYGLPLEVKSMKRFLLILLIILFCPVIALAEFDVPKVSSSTAFMLPKTEEMTPNYDDDRDYKGFAGRLHICSVGIDVALYRSNKQYVVDRADSAAYFDLSPWNGHMLIADHNTQGFDALLDVEIGMICTIFKEDGTVAYYECVDVFDGHNTGKYISNWDGKIVMHRADLLMYTCLDYWKNVRVTLWDEIEYVVEYI
jgi:hypothetical protein